MCPTLWHTGFKQTSMLHVILWCVVARARVVWIVGLQWCAIVTPCMVSRAITSTDVFCSYNMLMYIDHSLGIDPRMMVWNSESSILLPCPIPLSQASLRTVKCVVMLVPSMCVMDCRAFSAFRWPMLEMASYVMVSAFKSFLLGSQDLKVNLCGLQQDKRSDGKSKKIVGIAQQFPCYSYTVGPYGKGPTGDYTTCTYVASKNTAFSINNDRYLITWP